MSNCLEAGTKRKVFYDPKDLFSRTPDNLVLSLNIYYWPLISKDSPITIFSNLTNMFVNLFRRFERYRKYQKLVKEIFLCHAVVKVPSLSLVYPCNYWFDTTRSQPKNDSFSIQGYSFLHCSSEYK